jgi:hypothetical protein
LECTFSLQLRKFPSLFPVVINIIGGSNINGISREEIAQLIKFPVPVVKNLVFNLRGSLTSVEHQFPRRNDLLGNTQEGMQKRHR